MVCQPPHVFLFNAKCSVKCFSSQSTSDVLISEESVTSKPFVMSQSQYVSQILPASSMFSWELRVKSAVFWEAVSVFDVFVASLECRGKTRVVFVLCWMDTVYFVSPYIWNEYVRFLYLTLVGRVGHNQAPALVCEPSRRLNLLPVCPHTATWWLCLHPTC